MNLLVVEDSDEVRQRLCQLLAAIPSLQIAQSATLAAGIEQLRQDPPDIVILDLQLPDGDGVMLLKTSKREFPATRVLVLTNHICRRRLCMEEGADCFFDKSLEFMALLDAVKERVRHAN